MRPVAKGYRNDNMIQLGPLRSQSLFQFGFWHVSMYVSGRIWDFFLAAKQGGGFRRGGALS